MYTCILVFFTVFLKNRNIRSKIKRSKVTDYAALTYRGYVLAVNVCQPDHLSFYKTLNSDYFSLTRANIQRIANCI